MNDPKKLFPYHHPQQPTPPPPPLPPPQQEQEGKNERNKNALSTQNITQKVTHLVCYIISVHFEFALWIMPHNEAIQRVQVNLVDFIEWFFWVTSVAYSYMTRLSEARGKQERNLCNRYLLEEKHGPSHIPESVGGKCLLQLFKLPFIQFSMTLHLMLSQGLNEHDSFMSVWRIQSLSFVDRISTIRDSRTLVAHNAKYISPILHPSPYHSGYWGTSRTNQVFRMQ